MELKMAMALLQQRPTAMDALVGRSKPMNELKELMRRAASGTRPVHIRGEPGTGKLLVAKAIHELGEVRGALIHIDCSELAGSAAAETLYGRSGPEVVTLGALEHAANGVVVLDDLAEFPEELEGGLSAVMEAGSFMPVGTFDAVLRRRMTCRVVTISARRLDVMAEGGRFPSRLWHHVSDTVIDVPPLRARRGDVAILARHFLADAVHGSHLPETRLESAAIGALARHAWPGNVRELRNVMWSLALRRAGKNIRASDVLRRLGA